MGYYDGDSARKLDELIEINSKILETLEGINDKLN